MLRFIPTKKAMWETSDADSKTVLWAFCTAARGNATAFVILF